MKSYLRAVEVCCFLLRSALTSQNFDSEVARGAFRHSASNEARISPSSSPSTFSFISIKCLWPRHETFNSSSTCSGSRVWPGTVRTNPREYTSINFADANYPIIHFHQLQKRFLRRLCFFWGWKICPVSTSGKSRKS